MASPFDQERIYKIFSFFYGAAFFGLGIWVLYNIGGLVLDPGAGKAVLFELPDHHTGLPPTVRIVLFAAMAVAALAGIAWGALSMSRAGRRETGRINGIALALIAVALGMLELAIGTEAGRADSPLADPFLYSNPACGDSYYRMARPNAAGIEYTRFDPQLGWTGTPDPDTTAGGAESWFFGGSGVAGLVRAARISPSGGRIRNHGVAGYGLDQAWLRYWQDGAEIDPGSTVYFALLPADIDLSLAQYSFGAKPVFRKQDDGYTFIPPSAPSAPANSRASSEDGDELGESYAVAVLRSLGEMVQAGFDRTEAPCRRGEKMDVTGYLIGKITIEAERRGHDLRWILLTDRSSFVKPANWRRDFLAKTLRQYRQTVIDAQLAVACAAGTADGGLDGFFDPDNGHLNDAGSAVVAAALADVAAGGSAACPVAR